MRFWCRIGLHHFAFEDNRATCLHSSHESSPSVMESLSHHRAKVRCLFCDKTIKFDYNMSQISHSIMYVKDAPKVDRPAERMAKVQPQEVKVKPTDYEEPKL